MKPRRPRGVDLLPLLDVMITVTFTFATIREVQLEGATSATAATSHALSSTAGSLRASETRLVDAAATAATAVRALSRAEFDRDAATEARKIAEVEAERATQVKTEVERRLDLVVRDVDALRKKAYAATDGERIDSVLSHLLKRSSVVEIELVGLASTPGAIPENRCCYRSDPRSPAWLSCGSLPLRTEELGEWSRIDGDALLQALEETKGGNALAVIRQASSASYKSGEKLDRFLRDRVSGRTLYIEERGLDMPARTCTKTP